MPKSLHILADLHRCGCNPIHLTHRGKVRAKTLQLIRRAGFQIIASRFHKFIGNPHGWPAQVLRGKTWAGQGGITGVVIVSESHLALHTWPEKRFVNLDIFFCNYSRDNTRKARVVFQGFKSLYQPTRMRLREVWRD